MDIIKFFYDTETTGTNPYQHAIHQLSLMIEVNNVVDIKQDFRMKPHQYAAIDTEALKVSNTTMDELMKFPEPEIVYKEIISILSDYVDRFYRKDKMFLVGYNNKSFDDLFFRQFFILNHDNFFGSWFFSDSRDVMVLASEYLEDRRSNMPNFKLHSVSKELGLEVDKDKLHDGEYDVFLTREIYRIVTGRQVEI